MMPPTMPTVTLLVAAALALLNLWLAIRVMRLRYAKRVSLGNSGDALVEQRVRAHGNLTEYAPTALILMALIEMHGASPTGLWALGALLVIGRLLHPFGLERPAPNALRAVGMVLTWGVILMLAIWAVVIAYSGPAGVTYLN